MTTTFFPFAAIETRDLLSGESELVLRWRALEDEEHEPPVIEDMLGRRMLVTHVTLRLADEEMSLYLGGFPASKVASKRSTTGDSFPSHLDLEDHWETLRSLQVEFTPIITDDYGPMEPMEHAHG